MSTAIRLLQGYFGRVELLNMDHPLVRHAHSQCHVLIKISGADTFFSVRDKRCPLNERTAVLVNTWEPHAYVHHDPKGPSTVILALYIEPRWLGQIERSFISSGAPGFFPHACAEIPKPMRTLSNTLAMQMLYGEQLSDDYLQSELSNLMVLVIDAFSQWRRADLWKIGPRPYARDARIRRAMSIMRANVGAELDTSHLASETCLSRAHFFKLFREQTNLTPNLYNNILRVEAAIQGLTATQESMNRLSTTLGFSAQSHFTRFFQQHTGVVPSQYRKVVDIYRPRAIPARLGESRPMM
ncbi:MAG: AraC family transcriptional regulator [Candidimonas sp.]|nr:MAG: AraC family transcriptional regulator [Candidimonas sp.]